MSGQSDKVKQVEWTMNYITAMINPDENGKAKTFTIQATGLSRFEAYAKCEAFARTQFNIPKRQRKSLRYFEYGELLSIYGVDIGKCGRTFNVDFTSKEVRLVPAGSGQSDTGKGDGQDES